MGANQDEESVNNTMQLVNEIHQIEQELITPLEKRSTTPDLQA
jgi:hypothetical protein